ncbi:MAG: ABC-2 family transporter protein [Acidimicrobiia bacterium]
MRSLREYVRLYFMIEAQYIKARMHYRADFIISSIGMFFSSLVTLGVFWVLFESITDLAGWTLQEMVFIYAFYMVAISPMQILFDHIWQLRFQIEDGSFIKYYFRPLNMMFYYMSEMFDIKGIVQLVVGIGLLAYASAQLGIDWTLGNIGLLLAALLGASLVQIAVVVIAACTAFWLIDSWPVLSLSWRVREVAPYPMTIFSGAFRFFFTFVVPVGFIAFYPSQMFLRPGTAPAFVYVAPLVGVLLFVLMYRVWARGVNSWSGTGS